MGGSYAPDSQVTVDVNIYVIGISHVSRAIPTSILMVTPKLNYTRFGDFKIVTFYYYVFIDSI